MKIYIKIEKTITKFGDIEIWKQKFHQQKGFISIKNVDISKIAVSNKFPFSERGFKHFIGYKDAKTIKHLNIFLPKKTAYRRDFDETKYTDDELLKKYNKIWEEVKNILKKKKKFDGKPVYNKKYQKNKIKPYNGKINTN